MNNVVNNIIICKTKFYLFIKVNYFELIMFDKIFINEILFRFFDIN